MSDKRRPSAASKATVIRLLREGHLPMPPVEGTRAAAVARWTAHAERVVAKLRKDHPRAIVIAFRKRIVSE